ncbi:MAG: sulfite exporter TauE/SafE family protein [Hyphomicrobiales bacterium]|nr:sulfite exporter TauE/SafE family protein [Hyphomicrobiales bacterium]
MDDLLVLSVTSLVAGFLKGVTGFGFALAAVPLYSLIVSPLQAVVIAQIVQIAQAPVEIYQNYRSVNRKAVVLLCMGALVFTPIGAVLTTRLPADVMRLAICFAVLAGLALLISQFRIPDGKGPAITAGAFAGLLGGLAAMPGPPAVAYFLGRGADKAASRASLLLFFAFTAVLALSIMIIATGSRALHLDIIVASAMSYPASMVGAYAGTLVFQRLGDAHYRYAALGVLFISALLAGAKGIAGLF